jgi:DNA-binding CsgD family transcriptional regulator
MKKNSAIAYIRRLCCLGIEFPAVLPELLASIRLVIPTGPTMIFPLNQNLTMAYAIPEFVIPDVEALFIAKFPDFINPAFNFRWCNWFKRNQLSANMECMPEKIYTTELYLECLRPYDQHHNVFGLIHEHNKPLGVLALTRAYGDRPFTQQEQHDFKNLLPYLAYAWNTKPKEISHFADAKYSGLIVVNTSGKLVYQDSNATKLLLMARYPSSVTLKNGFLSNRELSVVYIELARRLRQVFNGLPAKPPSAYVINVWGEFQFKAYWLDNSQTSESLIGIHIELKEPLEVKAARFLSVLSPVQQQICGRVLNGKKSMAIAQELNIRLSTVKDHLRKAYIKMNVGNSAELLALFNSSE